jgi:hypothetical protein
MRASLNRTADIDRFLTNTMAPEDAALFQARLLLDRKLARDTQHQEVVHYAIRSTARQQLKAELELLHQKLMHDPERKSFWKNIYRIFN